MFKTPFCSKHKITNTLTLFYSSKLNTLFHLSVQFYVMSVKQKLMCLISFKIMY